MADRSVDISKILDDFAAQSGDITNRVGAIDTATEELNTSVTSETAAIGEEANLKRTALMLTDELIMDKERKNKQAAAFFGTNPEAANSVIQAMSAEILDQHGKVQASAAEILQKQNTKFSDDPIEWITNAFMLPSDIAAHNTREAILERSVKTLQSLEMLTQEQVKTNNAIAATTSTAISAANADALLAAATVRAANAKQQALRDGVQFGSVRLAATHMQFESQLQVFNAEVSLQHLQLAQQTKDINLEMRDLQKQNLQLIIDKRDEDAEARAAFQNQLDKATGLVGMRRLTVADYDRAPQDVKAALYSIMADPNTNDGRLGYDTVNSLERAKAVNAPLSPQINDIKEKLIKWNSATIGKQQATWSTLKPDQQHVELQKGIQAHLVQEVNNIPDSGGIYSAPPLKSLASIPVVSNTILWKSAFAPQAMNPMRPTSAQAFYDTAVDLVEGKKMPLDQAASEISTIYRAIVLDNGQQRDYNRFALPMQNTYRTAIRTGHSFMIGAFDTKIIDMTNETEVRNTLMRALSARRAQSVPAGTMNVIGGRE